MEQLRLKYAEIKKLKRDITKITDDIDTVIDKDGDYLLYHDDKKALGLRIKIKSLRKNMDILKNRHCSTKFMREERDKRQIEIQNNIYYYLNKLDEILKNKLSNDDAIYKEVIKRMIECDIPEGIVDGFRTI